MRCHLYLDWLNNFITTHCEELSLKNCKTDINAFFYFNLDFRKENTGISTYITTFRGDEKGWCVFPLSALMSHTSHSSQTLKFLYLIKRYQTQQGMFCFVLFFKRCERTLLHVSIPQMDVNQVSKKLFTAQITCCCPSFLTYLCLKGISGGFLSLVSQNVKNDFVHIQVFCS